MDRDGIIHVGGRLHVEMSNLPYMYNAKHPVSKLVITFIHNEGHHNLRVNFTLAELQKYWIVNRREEIKHWKRECYVCNLEENAEVKKSWHPYLKPDVAHHCDVFLTVESILLAPIYM